ncbi:MAG: HepT-like ribonuclease domain-containing protein [Aggregatilineales bacterium]
MTKSPRLYLLDLLEYIARLEAIGAIGQDLFFVSVLHQSAAIRNFEVIGEIVKRLPRDLTAMEPDLPWSDYAGFRDVLIHQYDRVLIDIV